MLKLLPDLLQKTYKLMWDWIWLVSSQQHNKKKISYFIVTVKFI